MEYKITKPIFRKFAKWVHLYASSFSLGDWEVDIEVGGEKTDNRATCYNSLADKYCKIIIDPYWDTEPTEEALQKAAFHEVCELLLAPLVAIGRERFITEWQIPEATHAVIMRLQNMLID